MDGDEKEYRDRAEPELIAADPAAHKPPQLKLGTHIPVKWEIVADKDLQDYISRIGSSLVPQYQKDLNDSDPTKVRFQFYVVKVSSSWTGNIDGAAADLPSGVVLVEDSSLARLDNEAQLAAYLGNSIAHVLEKEDFLHHERLHIDTYAALAGLASSYAEPVSEIFAADRRALIEEIYLRCDRIALTYMLQQGYDIREAAFAHKIAGGPNFHDPLSEDEEPPIRSIRLMQELQLNYSGTDYSRLKKDSDEFQAIKAKALQAGKLVVSR